MAYGVLGILARDFAVTGARWWDTAERLATPHGPLWRETEHYVLWVANRHHFPGDTAALCFLGALTGARAVREGRGDAVFARWFTVVTLFAVGYVLEEALGRAHWNGAPLWYPDLTVAFVMLLATDLGMILGTLPRLALGVFVALVVLTQRAQGVSGLVEGLVMGWALVAILNQAVRALWRLSLSGPAA